MSANDPRGTPFQYWYSQSYGYYYTLTGEFPPWGTFSYHGTSWNLPVGGTFVFEKIPIPPDPCAELELQRDECLNGGGNWDQSTCQCQTGCTTRFCEKGPILF